MVALLVLLTILVFLTVDYIVQWRRARHEVGAEGISPEEIVPLELLAAPRAPLGVYFAPGHTWAFLEPSGMVRLGLTDFARSVVGSVEATEARTEGDVVHSGDVLLTLDHDGRTAQFRSPIDGVIERVDTGVLQHDERQASEPYTASWVFKIRPRDVAQVARSMLLGEEARNWLRREIERLKVFLGTIAPENRMVGQTLPDGGLPRWGLVDSLSEADWNKLQEKFFG